MSAAKPKRSGIRAKDQPIRGEMARHPGSRRDTVIAPVGQTPFPAERTLPPLVQSPFPTDGDDDRTEDIRHIRDTFHGSRPMPTTQLTGSAPPSKNADLRGKIAALQKRIDDACKDLDASLKILTSDDDLTPGVRVRVAMLTEKAKRILCGKS
jgi:hypothetical protein